ncbi:MULTISPECIES: hypothetical protein [Bacillus]|uniref:hypothetical protein n=1 Tax=Bacillus TaxID=1386 RepID=UPI0009B7B68E|nr:MULTISPECIES: hypothetical protein [Bacillus]ARC72529.1 hypothetical protein B37_00476 [Bacillus licheniformis]ARW41662.1 hypothetical protein S100141_00339 [Bacillus licheniformis]ARW56514.1 hypothetical protein S100027_04550 [Bacillus licheniformis]AXF87784.1 hypothetical protein BLDA23_05655 [Bacillus licheniformis]MCA1182427.1 hypothetical protein [Bacillus licheniformis]
MSEFGMDDSTLSALLDFLLELHQKNDKLDEALGATVEFISHECDKLEGIIMDSMGIPKDNTLEQIKKYGSPEGYFKEDTFCRDGYADLFYSFITGEIPKEKLIFSLKNQRMIDEE